MKLPKFFMTMIFASLIAAPSLVLAQDSILNPKYYSVTGVAQNDVLNVRMMADGSSEIVGALQPASAPIEVLFEEGNWGYVISNESNGYISMSFLQPIIVKRVAQTDLPQSTTCGGTEPFWDLNFLNDQLTLTNFGVGDGDEQTFDIIEGGLIGNTGTSSSYLRAQNGGQTMIASVTNRICSDGMSDRDHARQILLLMFGEGETQSFSGCCSVPPALQ